ncbi:MAG: M15 family metallopeptidase [Lachnospiraceae bacterium]|nr:M15 family metallopeptidase [Lachnospiraceae bacterium]
MIGQTERKKFILGRASFLAALVLACLLMTSFFLQPADEPVPARGSTETVLSSTDTVVPERGSLGTANTESIYVDEHRNPGGKKNAFSADDWKLILVNKHHPIPEDYTFPIADINHYMQCDARILQSLRALMADANLAGHNVFVGSPYRPTALQEQLFNESVDRLMADGYSYTEAYMETAQEITIPGTSEHEIGLAVDLIVDYYQTLDGGFGATEAGQWLISHCAEYGFIVRYPEGKADITGIDYEPWHFRFVGRDAAEIIMNENITLEEFLARYVSG